MKFVVLGGYGIIGKSVVKDFFKFSKADIIIAGRDIKKAEEYAKSFKSSRVKARFVGINNSNDLINLLKGSDVCVNCVQYHFNTKIMRACIKARVNYVDLGGLFHETKKQLGLNNEFKKIDRIAILGIGGAPGISNVLAAYGCLFIKKVDSIDIVFADVDYTKYNQAFVLPYSFKTLVEEFTLRPAVFKNGKTFLVPPGSGAKKYHLGREFGEKIGILALHSEIATLPKNIGKGIKRCEFRVTFPQDFIEKMNILIENGFASNNKIKYNSKDIPVIDIASKIMERMLPKENIKIKDKELIRVALNESFVVEAVSESYKNIPAGVVDTAVPCSIASIMIASGFIKETGVLAPEEAINIPIFFHELKKRNIKVFTKIKEV